MIINRDAYLHRIISYMWDGQVKVITGIRRCGKSFLLNTLFRQYLLQQGVAEDNIISVELDLTKDIKYRDPLCLAKYVRNKVSGSTEKFYLFVDEIQMSDTVNNPYNPDGKKITFYDALNDLRSLPNLDVYVTGSNSRMLSRDILTEFRGRSDEIHVHPLSFSEYYSAVGGDKEDAFEDYAFYGGMPLIISRPDDTSKAAYLRSLFSEVYIKDIVERKKITREDILTELLELLCSSVGSLTNPKKISDTLRSKTGEDISLNTISSYIGHLEDAFLFSESKRYDVKGRKYFEYPYKYYSEDIGLRNVCINFRQQEMTHIMENIIFNELIIRGFSVDIGVIFQSEKNSTGTTSRVAREIDFIATKGSKKVYIQSAFALPDEAKTIQESKPLSLTGDSFPKIIIRKDIRKKWYDDKGILNIGLTEFLLDNNSI